MNKKYFILLFTISLIVFILTLVSAADTTPPTYSLNSTNSTNAGSSISHNLYWQDDIGLSGYIFQFCSGTWNGTDCTVSSSSTNLVLEGTGHLEYYTSQYDTSAWAANNINDGLLYGTGGQSWCNLGGTFPDNFIFSFNSYATKSINKVILYNEGQSNIYNSKNFSIYVSTNDNAKTNPADASWTNVLNATLANTEHIQQNFTFNSASAKYVMLRIINTYDTSYTELGEFQVFETPSGGWVNDSWVAMTGASNWSNVTKTISSTIGLNYSWCVYANDTSNNWNNSCSSPFIYVSTSSDTTYPTFSSPWDNNATMTGSGTAKFNVTLTNTNGTVFLEINGINYTATNLTANVYNVSMTLGSGTYSYYWGAWGSGLLHWYNTSAIRSYTVFADTTPPAINFISPTPATGSQTDTSIYVNVSSSDSTFISSFINFDNSLVGWWKMDDIDASGSPTDYFGRLNGSKKGDAAQTSSGKFGKSFTFDGVGDYVEIPAASAFPLTNFTYSVWIAASAGQPGGWNSIIDADNDKQLVAIVGAQYGLYGRCGEKYHGTSKTDGSWHHLVWTVSGANYVLYEDGIIIGNGSSCSASLSASYLELGSGQGGNEYFKGKIDDFLLFNRSLSQQEVLALYANSSSKYLGVNFTSLSLATHSFKAYSQDVSGNVNSTETRSVTITTDISYPVFSDYKDNNATITNSGTALFNVTVLNTNGTVILNINGTSILATNLTSNVYNVSYYLINGTYLYNWTAYGNGTSHLYNVSDTRSYTINNSDTTYPQFSNNLTSIENGSQYASSNNYQFNITIANMNGTAGIEFNSVNYSLSNISNSFYWNAGSLGAGTYNYYFWSYGNGASHNYNISQTFSYTISKNDTYTLSLTATTLITYGTVTDFLGSGCPSQLTCSLNISNAVYSAGTINANYSTNGNANYTSASSVFSVTINKAVPNIISTVTSPITYGIISDFTCTGTNSGGSDLTYNLNQSNKIYGAGTVYVNCSTTGGQNYTSNSTVKSLIINKANSQTSLTFDKTSPQSYLNSITPTCSVITGQGTPVLSLNGTIIPSGNPITLGVGTWQFNCSLADNGNYSYAENVTNFQITQNNSYVLNLNVNPSWNVNYVTQTNVSGSGCPSQLTCNLYNNVSGAVSNSINLTLGAGNYNFTYNTTGNTNYSSMSISNILIVSQANGYTNLSLNGLENNLTLTYPQQINITALTSYGALTIYKNGVDITSTNEVNQTYGYGYYNITAYSSGNENYTSSYKTFWLNITKAIPTLTTLVNGVNNNNLTIVYPQQVNASGSTTGGTLNIYRDGNLITNGINYSLGVGYYRFDFNVTGNENYTNNSIVLFANVTKATSVLTFLANGGNSNLTLIYPQQINITASASAGTVGLDKDNINYLSNNGLNITLGVGSYIFRANITGNENYSDVLYSYYNITITKSIQSITPLLNGNNANLVIIYPQQINASYSGTNFTQLSIKINDTQININQTYTWGAGTWLVNYSMPSNQNYSSYETYLNLTINSATGLVNGTINGTASNFTVYNGTANQNIWINATNITGYGTGKIYVNGSLYNSGIMPLFNITNLSLGFYNITFIYDGNNNYTSDTKVLWVNVTQTPCITQLQNTTLTDWQNQGSCKIDDLQLQNRSKTEYDTNSCGEIANITYYEYQNISCNYCSYNVVNSSWSNWENISCLSNDKMNQTRSKTEYDENYGSCYAITGLLSDLWNSGNNNTYFEFRNTEVCDYCTPNLQNTTWGEWADSGSCLANNSQVQVRNLTRYDTNNCGEIENQTLFDYREVACDFCTPSLTNSSWSNWSAVSCLGNQLNQSRFLTQCDTNNCGEIENITYWEYQLINPVYQNTSWTGWYETTECRANNTVIQERNLTQYDANACAVNSTYFESREVACDYCTPNMQNTTWTDWQNQGVCLVNNIQIQNRSKTEYDTNNCEEILNSTSWEYKNISCDYCTPILTNSSWSDWQNISCVNNKMNQSRFKVQYDVNFCGEVENITYWEYQNISDCNLIEQPVPQTPSSGNGGGGGGIAIKECVKDVDCKTGYSCYSNKCVKLFDAKILDIVSPIKSREFFNLTYYIKGMAEIKGDVIITFWIQNESNKLDLGKDTIYLGTLEEKTQTVKLFMPDTLESGIYDFYMKVEYENYSAESYRKIEIIDSPAGMQINSLNETTNSNGITGQEIPKKEHDFLNNIKGAINNIGGFFSLIGEIISQNKSYLFVEWMVLLTITLVIIGSSFIFRKRSFILRYSKTLKIETKYFKYFLFGIFAIALLIVMYKLDITGRITGNLFISSHSNNRIILISSIIISVIVLSIFVFRRRKSKDMTKLKNLKGLRVYSENGNYIGRLKETYLEDGKARIYGYLIRLNKKIAKKIRKRNILVKHKHVRAAKHIMIIDEAVSEHLEKLGQGST